MQSSRTIFRKFVSEDLSWFRAWFMDHELSRRLAYPTDEWFSHVGGENVRCWKAVDMDGMPFGVVQVDQDASGAGFLALAVCPEIRGNGYGTRLLRAFIQGPGRAYRELRCSVETDHVSSLACLRRCGFEQTGHVDDDGFVILARSRGAT